MDPETKTAAVFIGLTAGFLALRAAFVHNLWGHVAPLAPIPPVSPAFTNTATVRQSLADLLRSGADISTYDCYVCHEQKKVVQLRFDPNGNIVLPPEHKELLMHHAGSNRNNNCYNCHDPLALDHLQTRDGRRLPLEDSTPLCAGCHGPTYRDWQVGIHGRTSGYWDRHLGPADRKICVSCHDPHAPVFPRLKPAPAPHTLHPRISATRAADRPMNRGTAEMSELPPFQEPDDKGRLLSPALSSARGGGEGARRAGEEALRFLVPLRAKTDLGSLHEPVGPSAGQTSPIPLRLKWTA